jgi:two-component system chemotaxis sensor kinase CheA
MPIDSMQDIRKTFFLECAELMEKLIDELEVLSAEQHDPETIDTIFRSIHSIKGGAGAFGFTTLVRFAHGFENVLDAVRSGSLLPDNLLFQTFIRAADVLGDLIQDAQLGIETEVEPVEETLAALNGFLGTPEPAEAKLDFTPQPLAFTALDHFEEDAIEQIPVAMETGSFEVNFTPTAALYQSGNDPMPTLSQLKPCEAQTLVCQTDAVPRLENLSPEHSYLTWTFMAQSGTSRAKITEMFDFIDGLCELNVTEFGATPPQTPEPQASPYPPHEAPATTPVKPRTPNSSTVRVDLDRLDRLVNLVGELVINQSMLSQHILATSATQGSEISSGFEDFVRLTRDIQDSVMTIRAQPVKSLFQRLNRAVREATASTGKEVKFVTIGEDTEIDKNVLEQLSEPLTHMIRNAFDHGLETRDLRVAAGKPEIGQIELSAKHKSGRVLLEMRDDGAGLDRALIRAKAVEKGLIDGKEALSDAEIDTLLFHPGFTTATQISELSGRGVGMDVVKRAIQTLGGRVTIRSIWGKGTSLIISLPLTLAIMEGMIVKAAGQTFVLPLSAIEETFPICDSNIDRLDTNVEVISVRGEVLSLIDLGAALGFVSTDHQTLTNAALLIDTDNGQRFALRVEAIEDQRQVVIKGLHCVTQQSAGVSAATILGNGCVSFIIDPIALINIRKNSKSVQVEPTA